MDRQSTAFTLMMLLRNFNHSRNFETAEYQKRSVNERFTRSNRNIERCIATSSNDLNQLIYNCSDIIKFTQESKIRIENVRERLLDCKNLLLLKRQDIRKLWSLSLEQNALVRMYDNIHQLKQVPQRLEFYLSKRLYIHACLLLLRTKEHHELRVINGLHDIYLQIREERLSLEDHLRIQLIDYLFDRPSRDVLGSKEIILDSNKNEKYAFKNKRDNRPSRKKFDQEFNETKLNFEIHSLAIIPDKYFVADMHQQSPNLYIEILVQSLSILSNLNETLEFLQKQCYERLHRIIYYTTQHIFDNNFILNNSDCLRDLLELSYEQFKRILKNIEYLLDTVKLIPKNQAPVQIQQEEYLSSLKEHALKIKQPIIMPNKVDLEIPFVFPIETVWETVQQVLSDTINEYIDSTGNDELPTNSTLITHPSTLIDYSQYLTKKPMMRSQQIPPLFQFSQSNQYHSMTPYLQEQNRFLVRQDSSANKSNKQYVCKPNYRNITSVHDVLQRIIEDIDSNCELHPTKRILDRQLMEFIRDRFIPRVINDIRESAQLTLSSTMKDKNHHVELIPLILQKQLGLSIPILQSTYLIYKSCEELCLLVKCLPSYADDFCQAIIDLLLNHRDACFKLYLSIIEKPESSMIPSISSSQWVKDQDINRHLRMMPAFDNLMNISKQNPLNNGRNDRHYMTANETETLLIDFSQDKINIDNICTNYKHIQVLATIHESLDWLYLKLLEYFHILDKCLIDKKYLDELTQITVISNPSARSIKSNLSKYNQLKLSRINLEVLSNTLMTISTFSYDILLVLFLEIRLHCFYYLSLLFRNTFNYAYVTDTDPDENILLLNRDLLKLQEVLKTSLNEGKFTFLFQRLAYVLTTIFISSSSRFTRMSELGVTKMCRNIFSSEQTLTQIPTIDNVDLMRAHRYYELLHSVKTDDIIDGIEENGPEYSEKDYINLLKLHSRSLPTSNQENFDIEKYEQMLKKYYI